MPASKYCEAGDTRAENVELARACEAIPGGEAQR
jgi:hypothetical protein